MSKLKLPKTVLTLKEVQDLTDLKPGAILALVYSGDFPPPLHQKSPQVWARAAVDAWLLSDPSGWATAWSGA